jgi:hypothetical protein
MDSLDWTKLMLRFEQDRTWLMLGMAIRMATDLNLHRKSMVSGLDTEEGRARDLEVGQSRISRGWTADG